MGRVEVQARLASRVAMELRAAGHEGVDAMALLEALDRAGCRLEADLSLVAVEAHLMLAERLEQAGRAEMWRKRCLEGLR